LELIISAILSIIISILLVIAIVKKISDILKLTIAIIRGIKEKWKIRRKNKNKGQASWKKINYKYFKIKLNGFFNNDLNNKIKILFIMLIFVITPIVNKYMTKIPKSISIVYTILLSYLFMIALTYFCKMLLKTSDSSNRYINLLYALCVLLIVGLSFVAAVSKNFVYGKISFIVIVFIDLIYLFPMISFMKAALDTKFSKNITILISIIVFFAAEGYMLFNFGMYNLSVNKLIAEKLIFNSTLEFFIKVIHFGGIYVFQYPNPEIYTELAYLAQFFMGMILNVIIIGFFVSYLSAIINKKIP